MGWKIRKMTVKKCPVCKVDTMLEGEFFWYCLKCKLDISKEEIEK